MTVLRRLTAVEGAITDAGANPPAALICEQAQVTNTIAELEFNKAQPIPMSLMKQEETTHSGKMRTYQERMSQLEKHQGQAYSLILRQCTQLLQDKLKQDATWEEVSTSYDPL